MPKTNSNMIIIGIIILVVLFLFYTSPGREDVIGQMEFDYSYRQGNQKELTIGTSSFLPSVLKFHCEAEYANSWAAAHNSPGRCWSTQVTWRDRGKTETFTMYGGDTKELNDYLSVTFHPKGTAFFDSDENAYVVRNWENRFVFDIINDDFLTLSLEDPDYEVGLGTHKNMGLVINNLFADNIKGGVWTRTTNLFLHHEETANTYFMLDMGENKNFMVPLKTDRLGTVRVEARPFIIINNNEREIKLVDNRVLVIEYQIVNEVVDSCRETWLVCCEDGIMRRECDRLRAGLELGYDCDKPTGVEIKEGDNTPIHTTKIEREEYSYLPYFFFGAIILIFITMIIRKRRGR